MHFVFHIDPDNYRLVLHPNKTNATNPKGAELHGLTVPDNKEDLLDWLQTMFDKIPFSTLCSELGMDTPVPDEMSNETSAESAPQQEPETKGPKLISFPEEGPLTVEQELRLRTLITEHWDTFPEGFRCDLATNFMLDIRDTIRLSSKKDTGDSK